MNNSPGLFHLAALLPLGCALIWSLRLAYRNHLSPQEDLLKRILLTAGWIMIILGICGPIISFLSVLSIILVPIALMIIAMAAGNYHRTELRSLLEILTTAAEKNIPLPEAARAFADRRTDEFSLRVFKLAELLEAGIPLEAALQQSRIYLPTEALLMIVREGSLSDEQVTVSPFLPPDKTKATSPYSPNKLRTTGNSRASRSEELEGMVTAVITRAFYFLSLLSITTFILTFMVIWIIPNFRGLFDDFGLRLPFATKMLVQFSELYSQFWIVLAPFYLLLFVTMVLAVCRFSGLLPRDLPFVGRFTLRLDAALVMRMLARAVRQGKPMPWTLHNLGLKYPKSSVRRRLNLAVEQMGRGGNWCDAIRQSGLIKASEAGLLQTAQRAGNLAWALEEMADSCVRRQIYRWRILVDCLSITSVLFFTACGFWIFFALFSPLVTMIDGMS